MAVEEETIVPEAGFLRYRYLTVAGWTTVGVLSMVWVLPFAQGAALAPVWMIFVAWTLFIVATASAVVAWLPLHVRSLRYCFEGDRLVAHSGVWYHSKVFIPYARITDINVQQGPLERRFGIHRVFVQTAGSYLPAAVGVAAPAADHARRRGPIRPQPRRRRAADLRRRAVRAAGGVDAAGAVGDSLRPRKPGPGS